MTNKFTAERSALLQLLHDIRATLDAPGPQTLAAFDAMQDYIVYTNVASGILMRDDFDPYGKDAFPVARPKVQQCAKCGHSARAHTADAGHCAIPKCPCASFVPIAQPTQSVAPLATADAITRDDVDDDDFPDFPADDVDDGAAPNPHE